MVSPVSRRHRLRRRAAREPLAEIQPVAPPVAAAKVVEAAQVPGNILCPISLQIMRQPVWAASTGITYDRESVVLWVKMGFTACPVTGRPLGIEGLETNCATLERVKKWRATHRANSVEPERQQPVALILAVLAAAAKRGDGPAACAQLTTKAMALGKEESHRHGARTGGRAGAGHHEGNGFSSDDGP